MYRMVMSFAFTTMTLFKNWIDENVSTVDSVCMHAVEMEVEVQEHRGGCCLGRIIVLALLAILTLVAVLQLEGFLSLNRPVRDGRVLVVEGWLPDYALEEALEAYRAGDYEQLITVGGPLEQGAYLLDYKNLADIAAATLLEMGAPAEQVISLPAPQAPRDRTENAHRAFAEWFSQQELDGPINVVSIGAHARRSRYLMRRVLDGKANVGVISVPPRSYDPDQWYRTSEGFKTVLSETVSYVYVRLFGLTKINAQQHEGE